MGERGTSRPAHLTPVTGHDPAAEAVELLRAVARGDDQAFKRLYDLVAPRVYGLARRVLRDPAQAEEVTQEVYLEIWQTAARYKPERGSAVSWMLTMAHRRAVDRVRASQAARGESVELVDDLLGHAEAALVGGDVPACGDVVPRLAADGDPAVVGRQQAGEHAQQRGLAGAVGPEDGEHLAVLDGQVQLHREAAAPHGDRGGEAHAAAARPSQRSRSSRRVARDTTSRMRDSTIAASGSRCSAR